jgi:hypothetical protein
LLSVIHCFGIINACNRYPIFVGDKCGERKEKRISRTNVKKNIEYLLDFICWR